MLRFWKARVPFGQRLVHHSAPTAPAAQLARLRDVIVRTSATNSKIEKETIIAEYPDLRQLLERIYDSHLRNHVTSAGYNRYTSTHAAETHGASSPPDTLEALLDSLSSKQLTGHNAFKTVQAFLDKHDLHEKGDLSLREVFWRVMDRNLKAGFSARTVQASAQWEAKLVPKEATKADEATLGEAGDVASPPSGASISRPVDKTPSNLLPDKPQSFSPALGKTLLRSDLYKVFAPTRTGTTTGSWFASRKLDGVRVLCLVDVFDDGRIDTQCLSRSAKEFYTLDVLKAGVADKLRGWPGLKAIVSDADRVMTGHGEGKRFVLDGELSILRRPSGADALAGAGEPDSAEPEMVEDFQATVSWVRRKDATIDNPTLFLLDVIPWSSFCQKVYSGRTFGQRLETIHAVTDLFAGGPAEKQVVRRLEQVPVKDIAQVEAMMGVAADKGWEGIILRRDVPYEGKRTTNIYKYKEWLDAEYTVLSTENSMQRLSVDGHFENRQALANVWIDHKGTPVSIGSGFTTDQRLRYGADPSLVVGKQITVEYFAESAAQGRPDEPSLRFPRVKRVWEEGVGKRDV